MSSYYCIHVSCSCCIYGLILLNDSRSIVWHGFHVVAEDWITYPDDYVRHATASLREHVSDCLFKRACLGIHLNRHSYDTYPDDYITSGMPLPL